MLTLESLPRLQALIADQRLDGWLLFDFKGRNPIASAVLGNRIVGTRRVFVKIPRSGVPVALVHEIDKELWLNWPKEWIKHIYIRREDLETEMAALVSGDRLALDFSPRGAVPYLDCVPAGLRDFLTELYCLRWIWSLVSVRYGHERIKRRTFAPLGKWPRSRSVPCVPLAKAPVVKNQCENTISRLGFVRRSSARA
jgi:hypothetical protein